MNRMILLALALALFVAPAGMAAVVTYPAPEGEPPSPDYKLSAGDSEIAVYRARVLDPPFAGKEYDFGGPYSFANFDVSGPVQVRITSDRNLRNTVIRPAAPDITLKVQDDHTLLLSLPGPRKISIEPDGKKGPLLLFANPLEDNPPKGSSARVIYFGPGVHNAGRINVTNGQTLYLAGGAVVKGGVMAEGENISITGRGVLDGSDYEWRQGPTPCVVNIRGTNVEVSGITIRGASHWTIVPRHSRNVTVRGVKLCGSRVQNDDGINPCNSQDVLITDCFIRSDDDCVALKGLDLTDRNDNVERITVENSVLWCDRARIFLLGHESRAPYMRDITLRNLDIIHFTMTPFLFEPGEEMRLENVVVENVRLHGEGQRELLRLKPVVNQYMRNKVPGHVRDIRFSNVSLTGQTGLYAVQLSGADENHSVSNVALEDVSICGQPLTRGSPHVQIGPHVQDVRFDKGASPQLTEQRPDGEFPGWKSFHEKTGTATRDVWKLLPDGVLMCKGSPKGYLFSEKEYTNLTLRLEWRYPAGATNANGGVLARMRGEHAVWPRCLEFQLNLGQAGDFWGIRGFEFTGPAESFRKIDESPFGVLRHLKRTADLEKPAGEWNRLEVVVQDGTATQWINGSRASQALDCEVVGGKILLTAEGQEIHFRSIVLTSRD